MVCMGQDRRAPLVLFLATVAVLAADQFTKELVRRNIGPNEAVPEHGAFRLVNITNDGIIFGLSAPKWFAIAMPVVMVLAVLAVYYWYRPQVGRAVAIAIGLFLGGTLGNWVDRLRFPGVTDFIDVQLRGDVHWFTFNLADIAIMAAIVVFVVAVFGLWPRRAAGSQPRTPPGNTPWNG